MGLGEKYKVKEKKKLICLIDDIHHTEVRVHAGSSTCGGRGRGMHSPNPNWVHQSWNCMTHLRNSYAGSIGKGSSKCPLWVLPVPHNFFTSLWYTYGIACCLFV